MSLCHIAGVLTLATAFLSGAVTAWAEMLPHIPEASANTIDTVVRERKSPLFPPDTTITLREAIVRTMRYNPELAAAAWEVSAREGEIIQTGLFPNPEIEMEAAEFGGGATRHGWEDAEITMRLSQAIALGGKRGWRKRAASLDRDVARWDFEITRMDMLSRVKKSFAELVAAQRRMELSGKIEHVAEQFTLVVAERAGAGLVPPLEESRARVELASERLKRQRADRMFQTARKELAALWGESNPSFEFASANFESISPVPVIDAPTRFLSHNPELNLWVVEMERRSALRDLERANRIPDISISGGVSRFRADRETAFVMGVSVPFPVFDRNQGNVRYAERQLSKAREERRAEELRIARHLFSQYQNLSAAYEQASALAREVIPVAREALAIAEDGYRAGKFSYLVVLDAQRTLFEAQEQEIEALAAYHAAMAEMERLTGAPLETLIPANN